MHYVLPTQLIQRQDRPPAMVVEDGGVLDLVSGDFEDDDSDYEGLREEVQTASVAYFSVHQIRQFDLLGLH